MPFAIAAGRSGAKVSAGQGPEVLPGFVAGDGDALDLVRGGRDAACGGQNRREPLAVAARGGDEVTAVCQHGGDAGDKGPEVMTGGGARGRARRRIIGGQAHGNARSLTATR
jgi:hypothetical protein